MFTLTDIIKYFGISKLISSEWRHIDLLTYVYVYSLTPHHSHAKSRYKSMQVLYYVRDVNNITQKRRLFSLGSCKALVMLQIKFQILCLQKCIQTRLSWCHGTLLGQWSWTSGWTWRGTAEGTPGWTWWSRDHCSRGGKHISYNKFSL